MGLARHLRAVEGAPRRSRRDRSRGLALLRASYEGVARVVESAEQFDQVKKGEVLVCKMTSPAWVVLFTKIGGLVTDSGGALSHPAVVSREFGIPAVVGTRTGTQAIKTGQRVGSTAHRGLLKSLADTVVALHAICRRNRQRLPAAKARASAGWRLRDCRCRRVSSWPPARFATFSIRAAAVRSSRASRRISTSDDARAIEQAAETSAD